MGSVTDGRRARVSARHKSDGLSVCNCRTALSVLSTIVADSRDCVQEIRFGARFMFAADLVASEKQLAVVDDRLQVRTRATTGSGSKLHHIDLAQRRRHSREMLAEDG